jgi:hypothetical protein
MTRALLVISAFIAVTLLGSPAHAWVHGNGTPICPYGQSLDDGFLTSPGGTFQRGSSNPNTFYTYATQTVGSGQSWTSAHPWNWCAAGVDDASGAITPIGSDLDPATYSWPSGYAYCASCSAQGGEQVTISAVASPTVQGFNFGLRNGIVLKFNANNTGTCTIHDNNFKNGSNTSVVNGYLVTLVNASACNWVQTDNTFDGNRANFAQSLQALAWINNPTGTFTSERNVFLNTPGRPVATGSCAGVLEKYDYAEGFSYQSADGHGEVIIDTCSNANATIPFFTVVGNTCLQPNNVLANGTTACFYGTFGIVSTQTVTAEDVENNVAIVNKNGSVVTASIAVLGTSYATFGVITAKNNFYDKTGSTYVFLCNGAAIYTQSPTMSGNTDMVTGAQVNAFTNATGGNACTGGPF